MTTICELISQGRHYHDHPDLLRLAAREEPHLSLRDLRAITVWLMADVDRHASGWRGEHAGQLEDASAKLDEVCAELGLAAAALDEDRSIAERAPPEPWEDAA